MNKIKTIASVVAIVLGVSLAPSVLSVAPAEASHVKIKIFVGGKWLWKRNYHRRCGLVWRSYKHHGKWRKHRIRACW